MSQYAVEAIIDRRLSKKNQHEYLVKWVGFSVEESTWEPLKNLKYVMDMVEEYEKQQEKKKEKKENSNSSSRPASRLGLERKPTDKNTRNLRNSARAPPKQEDSEEDKISGKKASSDESGEESEDQKPRKIMKKQEKMGFKSPQPDSKSKKTPTKRSSKAKLPPKEPKSVKCKLENYEKSHESNHNKKISPQKLPSDEEDEDFFDKHGKDTAPSVGNSNEEKLTILGMCRGCNDQFLYYVESSNKLKSYKTRSYMVDNYAENLISFYEGKIVFSEPPQTS